jgi:hypothetical protein
VILRPGDLILSYYPPPRDAEKKFEDVIDRALLRILFVSFVLPFSTWDLFGIDPAGQKNFESTSRRIEALFNVSNPACPGLIEYMKLAAEDNQVTERDVFTQTTRLFDLLSPRYHSEAPEATSCFPSELFNQQGRATMVAFAALASASGRNLRFYHVDHSATPNTSPLWLRVPPPDICKTTMKILRSQKFALS